MRASGCRIGVAGSGGARHSRRRMMPRAHAALAAAALLLLLSQGAWGCTNVSALSQQLDAMLAEYDRELAPAQPVRVHLALDLRHAAVRDDHTVHLLADLTLTWQEPRIWWNSSEWGCGSVLASPARLWLPPVELLNGAGEVRAALQVRAASDGRLAWLLRLDAAVPVALDLADWPTDLQTAVFKFGSRMQNLDELDLDISDIMLAMVFEAGAWELESLSGDLSTVAGRRVAAWSARLRRRAAAHVAATSAVLAAAVLMLLAAVVLPMRTRAPLCACASFTAVLWLVSALLRLPGAGAAPRALGVMCAVCAGAGAAAAAAALAARLAQRRDQPPRALRTLASELSRWCKLAPSEETGAAPQVGAWAALATLLDRVLSAALLVTLFVAVCIYL